MKRGGVAILVYNIDSTGGMERQAARLAEELARLGRRVVIVTSSSVPGLVPLPPPGLRWPERRGGVEIYRVPFFVGWRYETALELYELVAAWLLRRLGPRLSVVYAVQGHTCGVHAARVGPRVGLSTVAKLVSSGPLGDVEVARRTQDGGTAVAALRRLDRIVPLNAEARAECLGLGIPEDRLASIPNGIDVSRHDGVTPASLPELGPAAGRELVVFVGRLDPQKRIEDLLLAFAHVSARRPRARLAIAGDGPPRRDLEDRARSLGLGDRVAFLGDRPDVPAILAASSVFALPSAQEGISNALLEAMAARTPVVASDIPGNRVLVSDEETALLHAVGDAATLERALERLLVDRPFALRLAAAARARVETRFSIEHVARSYLTLFDGVPERRQVPAGRFFQPWLAALGAMALRGTTYTLAVGGRKAAFHARRTVTALVLTVKRRLGIERDLFPAEQDTTRPRVGAP